MSTKTVYSIDPVTLAYVGPQECYKTSIEPDTWQWTGLAMLLPPPVTTENEIAVALPDLSDWVVKPNYIGFKYWLSDGSEHEITEIGISPPEDALSEKPIDPPAPKTIFTSLKFLDRFTEAEQLSVAEATMTTASVKLWYDRLLAASYIDLADERIPLGLNALVSAGLLDDSRVAEIMTPEEQN